MSLATLLDCVAASLAWVARASWQASVVAALVLLAQLLLRGRVSARWRYNLWLLVVARLMLPSMPGTRFSPFNWLHFNAAAQVVASPEIPRAAVARATPVPRDPTLTVGGMGVRTELPREQTVAAENLPVISDDASVDVEVGEIIAAPMAAPIAGAAAGAGPSRAADSPPPQAIATTPTSVSLPRSKAVNRPMISLGQALAAAWCLGFLVMVARVLVATRRLALLVRNLPEVRDPEIIRAVGQCAAHLRLGRSPMVLEAPAGIGPALAGVLRPRLLLPAAALRGLGRNELRLVILHELVHLRRGDLALNWLLAVLEGAHWFNPLVWFAFARLRADRELACDERVLSISPPARRGDDCRDYGRAILKLLRPPPAGVLPGLAVGVLDGGGWARKAQLRRRITMIARFDRPAGRWPAFGVALSLLVGGVAFTGAVRGQDDPANHPADAPRADDAAGAGGGGSLPAGSAGVNEGGSSRPVGADVPAGGSGLSGAGGASGAPLGGDPNSNAPADPATDGAPGAGAASGGPPDAPGAIGGSGAASGGGFASGGLSGSGGPPPIAPGGAPRLPGSGGTTGRPGMAPGAPSYPGQPGMRRPGTPPGRGYPGQPGMPGGMMGAFGGAPPGVGIGGAPPEMLAGRVEDPEAAKADAKTAGLLRKGVVISMQGVPLDDFLHYLSEQTGADIFVDSKALGDQQIVPDAPVTLQVKEPRSAESLLELGLRSAGGNSIGYEISNGLVIVTTRAVLDKTMVTRSYDVGKLIDTDTNVDLQSLIQNTVAPDTWRMFGGNGAIGLFNRKLIVTATEPNHREIARLLALLTEQPAKGGAPRSDARKSYLDKTMEDLAKKLDDSESQTLEVEYELGPNHPRVVALKRRSGILRQQYDVRKAELENRQGSDPTTGPDKVLVTGAGSIPLSSSQGPTSTILRGRQMEIHLDHPDRTMRITGDAATGEVEIRTDPSRP
ncbi:MAG: hypothetical protein JWL69_2372 [Phycisphaerales bacterium]|nr:hypothetical protein [Phycisphaerales bacterium]